MSDISFPSGKTMNVDKLYSVKDSPESRAMINKAIAEPGDNSDYVVFKKEDKLMVAVGKANLFDYDKNDYKLRMILFVRFPRCCIVLIVMFLLLSLNLLLLLLWFNADGAV